MARKLLFCHLFPSLPLDRAGGFGGDVVDNPVDAAHLVDDAGRGAAEDLVRKRGNNPRSCRLADPSAICALEFKEEFRRSAICSVSATIGIDRFDSAHPADNLAIGSPAENTVRLAIAVETDEEWPPTVTTSRAVNRGLPWHPAE